MPHAKNEAASGRADFLNGRIQKKPAAGGSGLVAHLVHTLLCAEVVPHYRLRRYGAVYSTIQEMKHEEEKKDSG